MHVLRLCCPCVIQLLLERTNHLGLQLCLILQFYNPLCLHIAFSLPISEGLCEFLLLGTHLLHQLLALLKFSFNLLQAQ